MFVTKVKLKLVAIMAVLLPRWMLRFMLPDKFIVYGHLVDSGDHPASDFYRYPSLHEFDDFIKFVKDIGYEIVSFEDYIREDSRKKLLLTFDDGYKSVYNNLHPYMVRKKLPYMLFILTDPFTNPEFFIPTVPIDKRYLREGIFLSIEEVMDLKSQNVHIGFHTRSHFKLENHHVTDLEDLKEEITIPSKLKGLFSEPLCFAYPYLAPMNFEDYNRFMSAAGGYKFFFDTKGFHESQGNHFFRVSMDASKEIRGKKWLYINIKKQLIPSLKGRLLFRK